jgi:hypothetical protein
VDICGVAAFLDSKKLVNLLRQQRKDDKPYGAIGESLGLVLQYHGLLEVLLHHVWIKLTSYSNHFHHKVEDRE